MLLIAAPAHAQVNITQVQKLDFGKWFFGDNSSPTTITVTAAGNINVSSSDIIMFTTPRPGIYNITGLPAFTTFNAVNVTINQPVQLGGRSFTLQNFTTIIPDADGAGATTLRLGADLVTTGDSQVYLPGIHDGLIDIELDY